MRKPQPKSVSTTTNTSSTPPASKSAPGNLPTRRISRCRLPTRVRFGLCFLVAFLLVSASLARLSCPSLCCRVLQNLRQRMHPRRVTGTLPRSRILFERRRHFLQFCHFAFIHVRTLRTLNSLLQRRDFIRRQRLRP